MSLPVPPVPPREIHRCCGCADGGLVTGAQAEAAKHSQTQTVSVPGGGAWGEMEWPLVEGQVQEPRGRPMPAPAWAVKGRPQSRTLSAKLSTEQDGQDAT